jgi:glycosyltransferase involved in cell wall biosynthesis
MNRPRVSVIVLTYNHEKFVTTCLGGILAQDYPNFEVVVSDDASTDETSSLIEKFAESDSRIRFFRNEENKGPSGNFEFALEQCKGDFIALCEGDDVWTDSRKLSLQMDAILANPELSLVYADYSKINDSGMEVSPKVLGKQPASFDLSDLMHFHGPATNSVLLRREVFPKRFPEVCHEVLNPDVFILGYALHHGKAGFIDLVLSAHREHDAGIWTTLDQFERGLIRYSTLVKFYRSIGKRHLEKEALQLFERQVILAKEKDRDVFHRFFDELPTGRRLVLGLKWAYRNLKS